MSFGIEDVLDQFIREIVREELARVQGAEVTDVVDRVEEEDTTHVPSVMSPEEFLTQVKRIVGDKKNEARTLLSEDYGKSKFTDVDPELYEECLEQLKGI
jgi:hypothetical protein